MKKLIILTLFPFYQIFAQSNYLPGWIIDKQGKNIVGEINFKSMKTAHIKCFFRDDKKQEFVYNPTEIKGYGIRDFKEFVSHEIIDNGEAKTFFLEKMVDGVVDLYYFKVSENENYYLEQNGKLLNLAPSKDSVIFIKNEKKLKKISPYIMTISKAFVNAPSIQGEVLKLNYDQKYLVDIVKKYHEITCDSIRCIDYTAILKNKKYIVPEIGFVFYKNTYADTDDYLISRSPLISLNYLIKTSKSGFQNYFKTGLFIGGNNIEKRFISSVRSRTERIIDIQQSYTYIGIPLVVGKSISTNSFIFNFEANLNGSYSFIKKQDFKIYSVDILGNVNEQTSAQFDAEKLIKRPIKVGYEMGFSIQKNKFYMGVNAGGRITIPRKGYYMDFLSTIYLNPKIGLLL